MAIRSIIKKWVLVICIVAQLAINLHYISNLLFNENNVTNNGLSRVDRVLIYTVTVFSGLDFQTENIGGKISIGSGIVYSANGFIVTNFHVVRSMDRVNVILFDDRIYTAEIVGYDEDSDIALLKIEVRFPLQPAVLGISETIEEGEEVFAIGTTTSLALQNSVTKGVISGINRTGFCDYKLIQSDVASSPGFSGGPLVNVNGEVIGMMAFKNMQPGIEGLSFFLRIEDIESIVEQLKTFGRIKQVFTGIEVEDSFSQQFDIQDERGVIISKIYADSPAEEKGLMAGDIILAIQERDVYNRYDLFEIIRKNKGESIKLLIKRGHEQNIVEFVPWYL